MGLNELLGSKCYIVSYSTVSWPSFAFYPIHVANDCTNISRDGVSNDPSFSQVLAQLPVPTYTSFDYCFVDWIKVLLMSPLAGQGEMHAFEGKREKAGVE